MTSSLDNLFGSTAAKPDGSEVLAALTKAASERILILDGAMGTQIQGRAFTKSIFAASVSVPAIASFRATTTFSH